MSVVPLMGRKAYQNAPPDGSPRTALSHTFRTLFRPVCVIMRCGKPTRALSLPHRTAMKTRIVLLFALLPALAVAQAVVRPDEPESPDGRALPESPDGRALPRPVTPWIEIPLENTDKPCTVDALDVDAKVDGLHARVSTTITIRNPNARPISAPLVFPLPDGAAVCGYALEINGAMVDGVVVPKEKARVAFETEQRRGVDPGLVEAVKGNVWRTRVYPVPASGTRRVRVDWTAPLALGPDGSSAALALPMPGCPLAHRTVAVEVADASSPEAPELGGFGDRRFERAERFWRVTGTEENVAPRDDLLIALPKLPNTLVSTERTPDGDVWFCASVKPNPDFDPDFDRGPMKSFTVFWDASGSRAGDHAAEFALLRGLWAEPTGSYRLVLFRNVVEPAREFPTVEALVAALGDVVYDGGTDLSVLAPAMAGTEDAICLFTDGLDTLSGKPVDFGPAGGRVTAFVSGAERDLESLRQACGGRVFDPAAGVENVLKALLAPDRRVSALRGEGVADVQGIGSDAARRATVLGRLTASGETKLTLKVGAGEYELTVAPERARPGSTLATAWAAMRVQQLSPRADDNADELLALGRRFGLASPATSLLVLESLDQWLRHDVEPPESLPQMREQWLVAKKNRPGEDPEAKAARHLEMLKGLWKQRMEWWATDFSKVKTEPALREDAEAVGFAPGMAAPMPEGAVLAGSFANDEDVDGAWEASEAEDEAPAAMAALPAGAVYARHSAAAPAVAREAGFAPGGSAPHAGAISVKAWSPDTPYLKALDAAVSGGSEGEAPRSLEAAHAAYLAQRADWAASPAFYLDCAGWFFSKKDHAFGVRVLSNLAELRIEDPALLRVMAWRLKQAKAYAPAIATLRRVCKLRPEDAQSWRDLALALDEAGRACAENEEADAIAEAAESPDGRAPTRPEKGSGAAEAPALLAEALDLYRKVALTPWERHPDSVSLFAVEEYNALYAWCTNRATLTKAFEHCALSIEHLPEGLQGCPDVDLRIILSWDADETDVDLHVTEPSGEEAYYGHRRTRTGGDVSKDITDGYGPEEYLLRKAPAGNYKIRAHYFASHQQEVFGPATATATIFTDWGRPNQRFQTLSIRLEKAREMIELGDVNVGDGVKPAAFPSSASLRKGMTVEEVLQMKLSASLEYKASDSGESSEMTVPRAGGRTLKIFFEDGKLVRAVEILPGGAETILVQ